jgi:hypothetical protein
MLQILNNVQGITLIWDGGGKFYEALNTQQRMVPWYMNDDLEVM